LTWTHLST